MECPNTSPKNILSLQFIKNPKSSSHYPTLPYQGCPPQLNQPHGLACHVTSEYDRTKPTLMYEMQSKLEEAGSTRCVQSDGSGG